MWDKITYPFLYFNDATVEVYEWISNFIPDFTGACDFLSMLGLKLNHISKREPRHLNKKMEAIPFKHAPTEPINGL